MDPVTSNSLSRHGEIVAILELNVFILVKQDNDHLGLKNSILYCCESQCLIFL